MNKHFSAGAASSKSIPPFGARLVLQARRSSGYYVTWKLRDSKTHPNSSDSIERGREVLSYVPGSAQHHPWPAFVYSEENLCRSAQLLRQFHDATFGFSGPDNVWSEHIPGSAEVICHGDIGPYNTIYVDQRAVALIDFDRAAPGPRIWDLAFAVYRFAPLCELSNLADTTDGQIDKVARRIRRFCDYYGLEKRAGLLDAVLKRLSYQTAWLRSPEHVAPHQRGAAEERIAFYQREIIAIAWHVRKLERYL